MMAYRTSVHESRGYTPHFLVYGQEVCLPIDFMYPNPTDQPPADFHEDVSAQVKIQEAYDCMEPPTKSIKKFYYITPLF